MIRYATLADAKKIVPRWNGNPSSVQHIGDHGNSVFRFENSRQQPQILRLTDPEYRSFREVQDELEFLKHLKNEGASVAAGLLTQDGLLAFTENCDVGELICSAIEFAPGIEVSEGHPFWNRDFFFEWGRSLGQLHNASSSFKPPSGQPFRWVWKDEILFAQAQALIPQDDVQSRIELRELLSFCDSLQKTSSNFGIIHADHGPQNFHYAPDSKKITTFDFGNCCYHWFISDIAISLSTIRRKQNRIEIRDCFLSGYASVRDLPDQHEKLIDHFLRLRVLYVYLDRLHMWSAARTPEQERILSEIRSRVHSRAGWGGS